MTRRRAALLAVITLVATAGVWLVVRDGSEPPEGLEVVGGDTEVAEREDADTELLESFSEPASIVYAVRGDGDPPYELRFDLPEDFDADPSRLVAASREEEGQMWALTQGQVVENQFIVHVSRLSDWQLRVLGVEISIPDFADLERVLGARAEPPECGGSQGLELVLEDPGQLLLGPCVTGGPTPALEVANNRAVSLELDLPEGAEATFSGPTLTEGIYDAVLQAVPGSQLRLLPGAGDGLISIPAIPLEILFTATPQAALADVAIALLSLGKTKVLEDASNAGQALQCIHQSYRDAGPVERPGDLLRGVAALVGACGEAIGEQLGPQALADVGFALGLPRLIYGFWDSISGIGSSEAAVRVGAISPALLPMEPPPDTVAGPGVSCGVIEDRIAETGAAVALELGVTEGEVACEEIEHAIRGYVRSSGPCSMRGAGTCVRPVDHWTCLAPTLANYPVIVSCTDQARGQAVAGLDRNVIGPGESGSCGNPILVEPPGPYEISANFADCEAALRIAETSFDGHNTYPYACKAKTTGIESASHTCTFGDSRVTFISGA